MKPGRVGAEVANGGKDPKTGRFLPGHKFAHGRILGSTNKQTKEGREFCRKIIFDEEYQNLIVERMMSGEIHPTIERMVWAYALGEPPKKIEIEDGRPPLVLMLQQQLGFDPLANARSITAKRITDMEIQQDEPMIEAAAVRVERPSLAATAPTDPLPPALAALGDLEEIKVHDPEGDAGEGVAPR